MMLMLIDVEYAIDVTTSDQRNVSSWSISSSFNECLDISKFADSGES